MAFRFKYLPLLWGRVFKPSFALFSVKMETKIRDDQTRVMGLFDLERLVRELNYARHDHEGELSLKEAVDKTPSLSGFGDKWATNGKEYSLIQTDYDVSVSELFSTEFEGEHKTPFGSVYAESGFVRGPKSIYNSRYQELILRTNYPLELNNGLIVPKCTVRLYLESEDVLKPNLKSREDNVPGFFGFFWKRKDLSDLVKKEWFFPEGSELSCQSS